jgi:hypothetical protein
MKLDILDKRLNVIPRLSEPEGVPLGVCVSDCEIDYGQPYSDLYKVCFSLGCAFAEMRWGKETELKPGKLLQFQRKHS